MSSLLASQKPRLSRVTLKPQTSKLVLLVLAYLVLAVLYSASTPLGEGPDEPGHTAYVFFLAQHNRLPVQRADARQSDVPGEGHQPPLAYLLASAAVRWLPPEQQTLDVLGNPRFVWAGGSQINALAHGSSAYWPWQGQVLAWHAARLVSVVLGAATILLTFGIAHAIAVWQQADSHFPLLATALVAFNPQFLFTSALVTNDALLITLSTLVLWLVVREQTGQGTRNKDQGKKETKNQELKEPSSIKHRLASINIVSSNLQSTICNLRFVLLGVALGLALITKQNAVLLLPLALWSVLPWRLGWNRCAVRDTLIAGVLVFGSAALIAGWWYARNRQLYGDIFGLEAFRAEFTTQPFDVRQPAAWLGALAQLHDSFWARFGWMNLAPPAWVIALFGLLEAAAVGGWLKQAAWSWRRRVPPTTAAISSPYVALLALPLLAFAWLVSFALTAGLVAWQGRFLFLALPALAVLLACGLSIWLQALSVRHPRWAVASTLALPCGLFALALWLPFGVIRPAYPNQTLPEQTALAERGTPVLARFANGGEPGVELRGWRIAGNAAPGANLAVTATWHALARQSRDWHVFMYVIDQQGKMVASISAPAKSDLFPMTQWSAGDWVAGQYTIALPPNLSPGTYTLQIGLFDQNGKGRRTGIFDQNNKLRGDTFDLTTIAVAQ